MSHCVKCANVSQVLLRCGQRQIHIIVHCFMNCESSIPTGTAAVASKLSPILLTFYIQCPGDQLGANRQSTRYKYLMECQVDTMNFLDEKLSLRKLPHAFGSELVKNAG